MKRALIALALSLPLLAFVPGVGAPPFNARPPEEEAFTNEHSLIVDDAGGDGLTRTQGAGDSRRKMTFSFWVRTSDDPVGDLVYISFAGTDFIAVNGNEIDAFVVTVGLNSATDGASQYGDMAPSTWYHVVVQIDTANVTEQVRVRVWIDNAEEAETEIVAFTQNYDTSWGANTVTEDVMAGDLPVGSFLIDEVAKIDNQLLEPTSFASSNLPIDISALTFGSEGYWLRFETTLGADAGDDSSGNGNDFTSDFDDADMSTDVP